VPKQAEIESRVISHLYLREDSRSVCTHLPLRRVPWNFPGTNERNRANRQKHGISFETAMLVFDDPYHLTSQDLEVDGEPRWQTIGMVNGIQLILVAHTVDEDDDLVRILSARKATPRERNIYGQGT
jgi:uncharacterized protein